MVIVSSLLKLYHLLKILYILISILARQVYSLARQLSLLCLLKSSESELILFWYRKIKLSDTDYDFFFSWLLIKSLRSFNTLNIWLSTDLLLYLHLTEYTCAVCWILCMSTYWISIANYNFSSQLPKQIKNKTGH